MTIAFAKAPGRVELLGNHTDYNQGCVLTAAIDRFVIARGHAEPSGLVRLSSSAGGDPVELPADALHPLAGPSAWANYILGTAALLRVQYPRIAGFRVEVSGDLPPGAGLSSSAALEVATACLLRNIFSLTIDSMALARLCRRAENEFVGVPCGLQDQVSVVFGRRGQAVYLDCRSEIIEYCPLPVGTSLLVFPSGAAHELAAGAYRARREECLAAARALEAASLRDVSNSQLEAARTWLDPVLYRRAAHIVAENERVVAGAALLRRGDGAGFGELMYASHESSRALFENSTPHLDLLVELARGMPGILGSRLTGGGFGGATISLVESAAAPRAARQLAAAYFEQTGISSQAILCESADGAVDEAAN